MHFDVTGPFEIARHGKKQNIGKESLSDLKERLEDWENGLSEACGCYIFAKRAGGGVIPWYIGQSCRRPILQEALNPDNITKYNKVLDDRGTPLLFIVPVRTPGGKLRKRPTSGSLSEVVFLERWLIAAGIERNPDLINNKETRFLRNLHVTGILNARQGEATKPSQELRKALWP